MNKNLDVYKGALYEHIIGEALRKCGYDLYYYKREDSTLEEDFFVRTPKTLLPIEVKATRGTAKSLRTLIQSEKYPDIECGITSSSRVLRILIKLQWQKERQPVRPVF
ncbi:MAG: DUF4143 domain-containing protein [Lachnospiraceae bacterium]|nr:DUF4143 domain-containing protein [Lachnospiraceae bacterium]